jgi:opacity protein-like surface antigen
MKELILYVAVSFISYTAFAQDTTDVNKAKSFIGVSGGYSNLMGNITKTSYSNPASGFANPNGYNAGLEGAYFFSKYIGIGGVFSFSSYNVSNKGLDSLAVGYQLDFDSDSAKASAGTKYNFYNYFVGPYFSFPIKKFTIDVRVVGGITHVSTAELNFIDIDGGKPHPFTQSMSTANGFGFQAGAGLRYSITKHLAIKLNVDYYYTDPNITIKNSNRIANTGRLITNYHQPITALYCNLGIAYQFGK